MNLLLLCWAGRIDCAFHYVEALFSCTGVAFSRYLLSIVAQASHSCFSCVRCYDFYIRFNFLVRVDSLCCGYTVAELEGVRRHVEEAIRRNRALRHHTLRHFSLINFAPCMYVQGSAQCSMLYGYLLYSVHVYAQGLRSYAKVSQASAQRKTEKKLFQETSHSDTILCIT